ncbi:hypothetical protein [Kitasatospora aureofaciens]|uniref:hypothetical protein n=1 Tax=Kitasatospora aureofaciens TaxID=1894 RepID=UPI001C44E4C7|nr:hypothetical protein [Kitasatospora aureofaciens]MBV6698660.1 hypothetical protein [Kitasatospora aureofaciens]
MGEQEQGRQPEPAESDPEAAAKAKARAKARLVFGDPLDRQSRDDTNTGWGDRPGAGDGGGRGLDWYLSQRPPHHGD